MYLRNLWSGRKFPWSITVSLMMAVTLALAATSLAGKGGGGRGKPPKDDPPSSSPPNPVLVFRAGTDVIVADEDGGNQAVVYNLPQALNKASWCSPEGTDIVFKDEIDGKRGVYHLKVVQVDANGNRTPLVEEVPVLVIETNTLGYALPECSPVPVGPDNRIKVVFTDNKLEPDGSLAQNKDFYLVNLDGSGKVLLLDGLQHGQDHGFNVDQYNPSWSPQGDQIVFVSRPWAGFGLPIDVEIIDVTWDDSRVELIPQEDRCCVSLIQELGEELPASPLKDTESILWPRWSNGGDKISLDSREGNTRSIWIIPLGEPAYAAQVQYDQIDDIGRSKVAWSPDDRQLVYQRTPRRGMCGEGDSRKVKGSALAVSNIDLTDNGIVDNLIDNCDEIAIATGGTYPDWWRNAAFCGDKNLDAGEQCDDGNRVDGDGCSAICMTEEPSN